MQLFYLDCGKFRVTDERFGSVLRDSPHDALKNLR
jgi:hypothetical protein